ncbi:WD40 repeat domain-containing serine/threonine protein kinase [Actinoplanes derwentensis]|uniref:WD40 repeat domain-containing serine/threonine protein kinase n=1 Tax=Actinoplanes derwentensis TaxID=113562 RepID=UPI00194263FC|nr:serine/threonine-protein kinase [Actinoplanes derwentensis]
MTEDAGRVLVGRYRLLRVLGRGGMGAVWLARDTLLDRDVAIKEVWFPAAGDGPVDPADPGVRRVVREAQAAAALRHSGIVTVHDVVTDNGRPWIVMELVGGCSLAEAIRERGLLTEQRAAEVGLQVLDALRAAHRAGVVHRDVKPANILLDNDDRVVLTDFGIAAISDATALTAPGQMIGSPAYLSPERIDGRPATAAADLWALGVTLYAAVTGRSPFHREDTLATLAAVLTSEPAPPAHAGRLWPVINGLLRKDPDRRLTAEQARDLLVRVTDRQEPGTPARRPRRRPTRSDADHVPATVAAPSPTVAATTSPQPYAQAAAVPAPAASTRAAPARLRERRRWVWPGLAAGVVALALLIAFGVAAIQDRDKNAVSSPSPSVTHRLTYAHVRTLLPGEEVCSAAWNPAGTRYAVIRARTGLDIFDKSGATVREFRFEVSFFSEHCGHNRPGILWDPAGSTVAVFGIANDLRFFNADTGTSAVAPVTIGLPYTAPSWDSTGSAVALRSARAGLVIVAKDGTVGRSLFTASAVSPAGRDLRSVAISPRGDTFVVDWTDTGREDGPLFEVRRFADSSIVRTVGRKYGGGTAGDLTYNPAGTLVAVEVAGSGVEVWNPDTGQQVATLRGPTRVFDLRWSANGHYLLAVDWQRIHVFHADDWTLAGELTPREPASREDPVAAGAVDNDGSVFLAPIGYSGVELYRPS